MKNTNAGFIRVVYLLVITLLVAWTLYFYLNSSRKYNFPEPETMSITLYVQDKEAARISDCRITKKVVYQIPKTLAIADASLKILFSEELKKYGIYDSVSIENGVAKIMLASDMTTDSRPISALSSCESGHLMAVVNDTLKQYPSVKSVELYSPRGRVEF